MVGLWSSPRRASMTSRRCARSPIRCGCGCLARCVSTARRPPPNSGGASTRAAERRATTCGSSRGTASWRRIPDQPSRRERRWRATTNYTSWNSADFLDDVGGQSALRVFERQRIDYTVRHLQSWYATRREWLRGWSAAEIDSDDLLRLRVEDLEGLKRDMEALVQSYKAAERDPDDDDAARVLVINFAFPVSEVEL